MYKVSVDKNLCIGCGLCSSLCEKVFEMKGDKAVAKVSKTNEKCAKDAAESCPVNAIKIVEI